VKQLLVHEINLIELNGEGDFLCPFCGTKISPDDETEEVYSVLEPKVRNNMLEDLLIRCNACSNKILLTGFSALENV
jgi:DNA-directed RNA polymerase subunit RPC12/RpoP